MNVLGFYYGDLNAHPKYVPAVPSQVLQPTLNRGQSSSAMSLRYEGYGEGMTGVYRGVCVGGGGG